MKVFYKYRDEFYESLLEKNNPAKNSESVKFINTAADFFTLVGNDALCLLNEAQNKLSEGIAICEKGQNLVDNSWLQYLNPFSEGRRLIKEGMEIVETARDNISHINPSEILSYGFGIFLSFLGICTTANNIRRNNDKISKFEELYNFEKIFEENIRDLKKFSQKFKKYYKNNTLRKRN